MGDPGSIPGSLDWEDPPWRRTWQPTPVFLPGESHGRRSLVGHSPRGRKESDTTEQLHFISLCERQSPKIRLFPTPLSKGQAGQYPPLPLIMYKREGDEEFKIIVLIKAYLSI